MTRRNQKILMTLGIMVVILFSGRWLASFLALRWWAGSLSPEASVVMTRWSLLGAALNVLAVMLATLWFTIQAVFVARSIQSVQVQSDLGGLPVRAAVPRQLLLIGAMIVGLILGMIAGSGAGQWRTPLALAWQKVRYGATDPLLGVDLGVLVGNYPAWLELHHFAVLLAVLGVVVVGFLYLGIGAIGRGPAGFTIHAHARRHLGILLAILAIVIATGYLLSPYKLATNPRLPGGNDSSSTRVLLAQAMAGISLAVAIMSLAWAFRPRNSLLLAGWLVLGTSAFTERTIIPAFLTTEADRETSAETVRELEQRFWGIKLREVSLPDRDTLPDTPGLWDQNSMVGLRADIGESNVTATAALIDGIPQWLIARSSSDVDSRLELSRFAAGTASPTGEMLPAPAPPGGQGQRTLVIRPRTRPGSEGIDVVAAGGIHTGGLFRRIALAWALQEPRILNWNSDLAIDWNLDPTRRIEALVPPLSWSLTGVVEQAGSPQWLLTGFATVARAPMSPRLSWQGSNVSGVVPALVALIDATTGKIRVFQDPGADELGLAWARIFSPIVESASKIPASLVQQLGYPPEWFDAQLSVLEGPQWGRGKRQGRELTSGTGRASVQMWGPAGPELQATLEDPSKPTVQTLVTARRTEGVPSVALEAVVASNGIGTLEFLAQAEADPGLRRLSDSVRAMGDTLVAGEIRRYRGAGGLISWQPWHTGGLATSPKLLWFAATQGNRLITARHPQGLLEALFGERSPVAVEEASAQAQLNSLRGWVRRADSALARGDLTAFGRAWEALKGTLQPTEPK